MSTLSATIYTCPDTRTRRVLNIFDHYGLRLEDELTGRLLLGEPYVGEHSPGTAYELAELLENELCAYRIVQDPEGAHQGTVLLYDRSMGRFEAIPDVEDGAPLIRSDNVVSLLATQERKLPIRTRNALSRVTGERWEARFRHLQERTQNFERKAA